MQKFMTLTRQQLMAFAPSYLIAKQQFKQLTSECRLTTNRQSFAVESVDNQVFEDLTSEVVWLGPADTQQVLVIISATHGVEGFAGAAVQNDLLARIQQGYNISEDVAVLLVFALNPYGFEHLRRCDESGVDLNRNFIDFNLGLPANDGYQKLRQAIFTEDHNDRDKQFAQYRQQHGQTAYEIAISGGQYSDPFGPFYGGSKPSHGRKVIESIIDQFQLTDRKLAVIDVHSGLGAYAHGELINDHPLDTTGFKTAMQWYGASVTAPAAGDSSSVAKLGLLDYAWHKLMQQRGCFVTLEFGSYSTSALFEVILQDHRSWKDGDTTAQQQSGKAMLAHFCPADNYWRELVLVKSRQVIQQAIEGLLHG